jgi:hypothetical protein
VRNFSNANRTVLRYLSGLLKKVVTECLSDPVLKLNALQGQKLSLSIVLRCVQLFQPIGMTLSMVMRENALELSDIFC